MVRTGVVCVVMAASATPVYAQSSASASLLQRARQAWDAGDFDLAPALYVQALDAGGLQRDDVLDVYVHLGAALAATGKRASAFTALRQAALLDPGFTIPPEAGKKAVALAERARRAQERVGKLTLTAQAPDDVRAGTPFTVDVTLAPQVPAVHLVTVNVRDSLAARTFHQELAPDASLAFEVPVRMTLPGASLVVRVKAVDAHDNELAFVERHVHVAAVEHPAPVAVLPRPQRPHPHGGGSFWTTAWPYVLGGATVVAGGVAIYFASRSTEDVNVGAPRVELVH